MPRHCVMRLLRGIAFLGWLAFAAGSAVAVDVVEYYNASLDHYFITWVPAEIANLDSGTTKGWTRTGQSFQTSTSPQHGTSPVCRFYIPPGLGDSHFFGRGTTECDSYGPEEPELRARVVHVHAHVPAGGRHLPDRYRAGLSRVQQSTRRQPPVHGQQGRARPDGGQGLARRRGRRRPRRDVRPDLACGLRSRCGAPSGPGHARPHRGADRPGRGQGHRAVDRRATGDERDALFVAPGVLRFSRSAALPG